MRVLSIFVAVVLVFAMSTLVMSQTVKNICAPIKTGTGAIINPTVIPAAKLASLSNRGVGNYTFGINLCLPTATSGKCGAGFVTISNATGCTGTFNTVLSRPAVATDGFQAKYGSSTAAKNDAEVMVLCNALNKTDVTLKTRSFKFASLSPNKLGGTTYMAVLFSGAACGSGGSSTQAPNPSSNIPSFPPIPSGGSNSNIPSGSSNLPSGGSQSNIPSGGSQSNIPSIPAGGSSNLPSGSSNMPSNGSGNNGPSSPVSGQPSGQASGSPSAWL